MNENTEARIDEIRRGVAKKMKNWGDKIVVSQYTPQVETHVEGETWTDENGIEWVMRDGQRVRILADVMKDARMPWWCPKCLLPMNHRFDKKFYYRQGKCYNCVINDDTKMMVDGTWNEVESKKLRENEIAFLKDHIKEVKDYIRTFTVPQNHYGDGRWETLATIEHFKDMFDKLKDEILACETRLKQLEASNESQTTTSTT